MIRRATTHGFSVISAVFGMLLLAGFAATTITIVTNTQESRAAALAAEQAYGLSQAGIEYAKNRIDMGQNPAVTNMSLGTGTFTVTTDPASGNVVSTGAAGTARRTHSLRTSFGGNCVGMQTAQAHTAGKNVEGLKLIKSCLSQVVITHWAISWLPNNNERIVKIQVIGEQLVTIYDNPDGASSGTLLDAIDFVLTRNTGDYPINKIEFLQPLPCGKTYTITTYFGDGSSLASSFTDTCPGGGH